MNRFICITLAAVVAPTFGQFCEKLDVHKDDLEYPRDLDEPDALGCFKYASIANSKNFIEGDQVTVLWEVHHTGANELHFALSEGPATKPSDKEGDTKAYRGAVYRTTGDGIGLHSLTYGYPEGHGEKSTKIRKTGQRFYELLMYPSGGVTIRRVSCDSNSGEEGCQRWGGGVSGKHSKAYTYNSNNNPHKFWMTFNKKSGVYKFGDGEVVGKEVILDWTDRKPIPVTTISANVYCCDQSGCARRRDDNAGYFCFCTNKDAGWCTGPPPPTTTATTSTITTATTTTTTATVTTVTSTSTTTSVTTVTTTTKRSCRAGEFRSTRNNECASCPEGQYQAERSHSNTACLKAFECKNTEYIATPATSSSNTVCATTEECSVGEYESKPHAPGEKERECSPITECGQGLYLAQSYTTTSDNVCKACDGSAESFAGGMCSTTTTSATTTTTTTTTTTSTTTTATTTTSTTTTASSTTSTATSSTTTGTDTSTTTTTTTTTLVEADDMSLVSITEADLTNAENAMAAASTLVERAETQLAEALKDSAVTLDQIIKADGDDEVEALMLKANVDPDQIQFLKDAYDSVVTALAEASAAVDDAQAAYATAILPPKDASTTTIVIVIAIILILAVIGGAFFFVRNNKSDTAQGLPQAFENPMYDSQPGTRTFMDTSDSSAPQQNSGYMDVPAAAAAAAPASSGYMDVSAHGAPSSGTAGYMDVNVGDGGGGGVDEDFADSDDEEV